MTDATMTPEKFETLCKETNLMVQQIYKDLRDGAINAFEAHARMAVTIDALLHIIRGLA